MQDRLSIRVYGHSSKKMISIQDLNVRDFYYGVFVDNRLFEAYFGKGIYTEMFSIGRKDKNNKLIFEGDIVKEKWYSRDDEKYRECLYSVEYDQEKMAYCFVEVENGFKNFFVDMEYIQDDYEVIGNIYEHKELLGGANE